jgi:SAM-dependent methyltransferase
VTINEFRLGRNRLVEEINRLIDSIEEITPYKIVLSGGKGEYRKIVFSRKIIKGDRKFQLEKHTDKQVFHENISEDLLRNAILKYVGESFRQMNVFSSEWELDVKISKKGKISVSRRAVTGKKIVAGTNNRKKKYILEEGEDIPVFKELGIFTKDGKVVASMYDKFRQINRFTEIVDDVLKNYEGDSINILDFGCGKSYLTFVVYHYLHEVKKLDVHITGLDLKEQVINDCNRLAEKFGYTGLNFKIGDINGYKMSDKVDMVMTLHACDTATDYALYNAVCWNAKYILSVPCCQHEVNAQIHTDKLSGITKYGIIKERMSALMTDSIRGLMLEACGYKTDIMEFIDIANSPKNLLIRAVKKNVSAQKKQEAVKKAESMCEEFGFKQTFMELLERDGVHYKKDRGGENECI